MPDHTDRLQFLSFALIILSLIAIALADKYNMRDLANAGLTVLGTGAGILTGKQLSQNQSTQSGDVINPPATPASTASTLKIGQ